MNYLLIKQAHILLALISVSGFIARALGRWLDAHWLTLKAVRIAPHIIDTLLFASGIALWLMAAYGAAPWLLAKLCAVLIYIVAGVFALRPATWPGTRLLASLVALAAILFIVMTAISKQAYLPL